MGIEESIRHALDITPWDKSGNSFLGLRRDSAKIIALVLITLGTMLIIPDGITDLFLNAFIAKFLIMFGMSPKFALVSTYTIIPIILIYIGLVIYPANTNSLFNGYIDKIKNKINKIIKNPLYLLITILILYFTIKSII